MIFSQLQGDGPVLSKVNVRSPKKPQRSDHDQCTCPTDKRSDVVVSKGEQRREKIEQRQEDHGREHGCEQDLFRAVKSSNSFLLEFRVLDEVPTNRTLDEEPRQKNSIWELQYAHASSFL
jgi:hypothetical protein